jgi:hypothetical protein
MKNSGWYTQADADGVDDLGYSYYISQYGLDFFAPGTFGTNLGIPGLAARLIPGVAISLPYDGGRGFNLKMIQNDAFKSVQTSGKPWLGFQFGTVVQMLGSGHFFGGVRKGVSYNAGDLLSVFYYDLADVQEAVDRGDVNSTLIGLSFFAKNRQTLVVMTHWPISIVRDSAKVMRYDANVAVAYDKSDPDKTLAQFNEIISIVASNDASNVLDTMQMRVWVNWP